MTATAVVATKYCPDCQRDLPSLCFHVRARSRDGLQSVCKACGLLRRSANRLSVEAELRKKNQRERRARWAARNPDADRNKQLKRFGITADDYRRMHDAQGGRCAICGVHADDLDRRLSVDHCHTSGRVRGLLCFNCNVSIGKLGDTAEAVMRAVDYLRRTS